jgi:hypothetical protein
MKSPRPNPPAVILERHHCRLAPREHECPTRVYGRLFRFRPVSTNAVAARPVVTQVSAKRAGSHHILTSTLAPLARTAAAHLPLFSDPHFAAIHSAPEPFLSSHAMHMVTSVQSKQIGLTLFHVETLTDCDQPLAS